jgi:hypothetical protein
MSHVLEHLDDPGGTLARLRLNLQPGTGRIVALVPINELVADENHKWQCTRVLIESWAAQSSLQLVDYVELDHWMYWILPVAHARSALGRVVWQGFSLTLGLAQWVCSPKVWFWLGRLLGVPTFAKPAQAGFVLSVR